MHSAGARALREDDNEMSREAVLLQWERKIEVAERLEDDASSTQPVPLRSDEEPTRTKRFERSATEPAAAQAASDHATNAPAEAQVPSAQATTAPPSAPRASAPASVSQRRTITITGQPTPARRRRAVVDAQLAQPDRIALWAFLLGLLLVAVAAGTAHA
jgi:thiol:disulfide interchange protein